MSYSEAMAEAYADAEIDEVAVTTLEFRHPLFIDDDGETTAIRIVNAYGTQPMKFRLENTAPLNAGELVDWIPCQFEFSLPKTGTDEAPELGLKVDNVSREITKYLEMAAQDTTPIAVTLRPYLNTDPDTVQMDPVLNMTLSKVQCDVFTTSGKCTVSDVHNWPFPLQKYTPTRFPGLVR